MERKCAVAESISAFGKRLDIFFRGITAFIAQQLKKSYMNCFNSRFRV